MGGVPVSLCVCACIFARMRENVHMRCLFSPFMAFETFFSYLNHVALVPPELSNPWVVDMA